MDNVWDDAIDHDGDDDATAGDGSIDWAALARIDREGCGDPDCEGGHRAKLRCGNCQSILMRIDYEEGALEVRCGTCDANVCRIPAPTEEEES